MKHSKLLTTSTILLLTAFLNTGCSESTPPQSSAPVTISQELKDIYSRSCKNCHTLQGTGAPMTGDKKAWEKILAKGLVNVVDQAMAGVGGMPPAGQCFECSPDQIRELILYMSNPAE